MIVAQTVYGSVPTLNTLRGLYGSTATFDVLKGSLATVKDIRQAGWWAQVEEMFVPVHFGTFCGWPIKLLWCAGGLSPGMLAMGGFYFGEFGCGANVSGARIGYASRLCMLRRSLYRQGELFTTAFFLLCL